VSEKGQGEESTSGTGSNSGIGVDGTPTGGGGSQADQSGPAGGTQTRGRGSWSYPDPNASAADQAVDERLSQPDARAVMEQKLGPQSEPVDLGKPDIPDLPEDPNAPKEPEFPGGGPTDTRSGWDYPKGSGGPRGEEAPYINPGGEDERIKVIGEPDGSPLSPGWGSGIFPEGVDPPDLRDVPQAPRAPTDRPPNMTDEEFRKWREEHPTMLDKANTQTDVT
jgi:hypothetical protein